SPLHGDAASMQCAVEHPSASLVAPHSAITLDAWTTKSRRGPPFQVGRGILGETCNPALDRASWAPAMSKQCDQIEFAFPSGWGGRRAGSGRKPNGERAGVKHRERAPNAARFPVHVTIRLAAGLPSLRRSREHAVLLDCFVASSSAGAFRIV